MRGSFAHWANGVALLALQEDTVHQVAARAAVAPTWPSSAPAAVWAQR
jgi:hypothetical protein